MTSWWESCSAVQGGSVSLFSVPDVIFLNYYEVLLCIVESSDLVSTTWLVPQMTFRMLEEYGQCFGLSSFS